MVKNKDKWGREPDKIIKSILWYTVKYFFYVIMVIFALSFAAVLVWILINSFKSGIEYTRDVFSLPKIWDWENYPNVVEQIEFKGYSLWGMLGNSFIYIGMSVFCTLTFPQMTAYTMAVVDFKGKKLIKDLIYLSMVIPFIGSMASTLRFLIRTGLYDSWAGVFYLCGGGFGFFQLVLTTFYKGIDRAYAESAYIDGASEWTVFLRIYYPQSWPIVFPSLIGAILGAWNNFMTPYLFNPSHPNIALGLQQMQRMFVTYGNDYPMFFAGIILMLIPILIIFALFSNRMLNNKNLGNVSLK